VIFAAVQLSSNAIIEFSDEISDQDCKETLMAVLTISKNEKVVLHLFQRKSTLGPRANEFYSNFNIFPHT
jgi:hypothetical protein